jgi:hypothetical protein
MATSKKIAAREAEALFMRSLVKAALVWAPSVNALRLEVSRYMLHEQGLPDLADLFAYSEPPKQVRERKNGAKPKAAGKPVARRPKRTPLEPATPINIALAGVRRHGAFMANGINTLADASAFSETELSAIQGIGPGLITALKDALPRASLALRAEAA